MKTNKLFATMIGFVALAFMFSLNYRFASNNYGVVENTLSVNVQAQTSSSGGGDSSGNGDSSGDNDSSSGTGVVFMGYYNDNIISKKKESKIEVNEQGLKMEFKRECTSVLTVCEKNKKDPNDKCYKDLNGVVTDCPDWEKK